MSLLTGAPRGTKDVTPTEVYKWHYLENILRGCAHDFGYTEIRFPTFEHTELFLRSVGDTTDVVQKEMYTFEDKGGRSISLRPEGTASVVRSCLENSLFGAGLPLKVYYIAPNFRYEKPQAGRLREHHQFGVEYFGPEGPAADAEVIALAHTYLKRLGIEKISLYINSIGCPECRPSYHEALRAYFEAHAGALCGTCLERLERNPMRILDCKSEVCSGIAANAPRTIDYLCEGCDTHFSRLKAYLETMDIAYSVNTGIVRGLDYYTRTVFEFVSDSIGSQGTVCGGGRYDGLIEALGGKKTPGLGFGSGMERLLMVMESLGVHIPEPDGVELFIAAIGEAAEMTALKLVNELRAAGVSAEADTMGRSLKAQMKYADKIKARHSIVLGDTELGAQTVNIKDMKSGGTQSCGLSAFKIKEIIDVQER